MYDASDWIVCPNLDYKIGINLMDFVILARFRLQEGARVDIAHAPDTDGIMDVMDLAVLIENRPGECK